MTDAGRVLVVAEPRNRLGAAVWDPPHAVLLSILSWRCACRRELHHSCPRAHAYKARTTATGRVLVIAEPRNPVDAAMWGMKAVRKDIGLPRPIKADTAQVGWCGWSRPSSPASDPMLGVLHCAEAAAECLERAEGISPSRRPINAGTAQGGCLLAALSSASITTPSML